LESLRQLLHFSSICMTLPAHENAILNHGLASRSVFSDVMDGGVTEDDRSLAASAHLLVANPNPLFVTSVKETFCVAWLGFYGRIHLFQEESMTTPDDVGCI